MSPKRIATFRTTGGLLDVFFFFGPDPMSVAKQYLRLVGFPSLPSVLLLTNGISRPIVYSLDGGIYNSKTLDIQTNAEGRKPAQLYDLAHPRGAYSFHELLSDQELEYAVDYQGTLVLQRPECVIDGNASAHMLNVSTYSNLRNAYETILAKTMYRSISKNSGVLAQLLVRSTFPGAGRWSGYWNPERNPYKRSVQDKEDFTIQLCFQRDSAPGISGQRRTGCWRLVPAAAEGASLLIAEGVNHDATSPFLITVS
ncbi:hypothetical protein HPB52_011334 [Rhipicephalus sanguineus]|uniref:Uncharacterized protein n=1 Tax=Rhipicephalus sanguineus TaxID=34632 RepID=A0A9D4PLA6_RHISA|nr:hypothetical protein HPB52_011334 [Rhipicephalus sanguineus]